MPPNTSFIRYGVVLNFHPTNPARVVMYDGYNSFVATVSPEQNPRIGEWYHVTHENGRFRLTDRFNGRV